MKKGSLGIRTHFIHTEFIIGNKSRPHYIRCNGCNKRLNAGLTLQRKSMFNGKYYCGSCFLQASHGIVMKTPYEIQQSKFSHKEVSHLCKMCGERETDLINRKTGSRTHFCYPCQIKFKKMVEEDPKK